MNAIGWLVLGDHPTQDRRPNTTPFGRMGLLSNILFFPITGPVAGIRWSLRKVAQVVDEELTDDTPIKQELLELQMQQELGDIDDAEYVRREALLMARLREVRAWRERLGKSVPGGPVRVASEPEEPGA
jgi:Gas vesicle protein G